MDEDNNWDLLAVVRSCATTFPPSSARGTTISTTNLGTDPFPSFSSPTSKNSYHMHQCPDPLESSPTNTNHFKELQELYKPYTPSPLLPQPAVTQINPNTSSPAISVLGEFTEHKPQPVQTQPVLHRQFRHQKAHHVPSSPLSFRPSPPMFPRPIRRRKVQQKRMVSHVSAERLSADMWAWRKYGQKPIKGSPHPRNYYRCSSSKGCAARKQVERSPSDPNVFVVTYTGEHTHPRPTHRSSLSGSSRKFSGVPRLNSSEILNPADQSVVAKLSFPALNSPVPATSLSPTTPLTASMEYDTSSQNPNKVKDQPINEDEENPEKIMGVFSSDDNNDHDHNVDGEEDDGEDDYGLLIPNMVMSEDIFMGLQELGRANSSLAACGKFPGTGGGR